MTKDAFSMGRVALTVNDLDTVGGWYEKAVGLAPLARDGETATYGAGDRVLLELRADKAARRRLPREAGLFHTAFLMPSRAALGQWTKYIAESRIPIVGASDHKVSEALYLTDPEGNEVEVYSDRPSAMWEWANGTVSMGTEALDVMDLINDASPAPFAGAIDGTMVGHVHLQVGALSPAEEFYHETLGLDITAHYPSAAFYSANGYHHHIATNIWNSRGAGKRSFPSTGLSEVEILVGPERAAEISARAGALDLADPWGTPVALRVAA